MQKIDYKILDKRMRDFQLIPSTKGSAAVDLRACVDAKQRIYPRGSIMAGTGISIHIKDTGFAGLVLPRSGLGVKNGIVLKNLVGLTAIIKEKLKSACSTIRPIRLMSNRWTE